MSELVFVSFGNSPNWSHAKYRLYRSIKKSFPNSNILILDQDWLVQNIFYRNNIDFFNENSRGFGLWIWKPLVILEAFKKFPNSKFIIYLDSGCELNINAKSINRFYEYLCLARDYDALGFELNHLEKKWTSAYTYKYLKPKHSTSKQIHASILIFKKSKITYKFIKKWLDYMSIDNFSLTKGLKNSQLGINLANHRHDQSILSIIFHKEKFATIPDESWFKGNWNSGNDSPIWVARNRLLVSINSNRFILILFKFILRIHIKLTSHFYV
jgi:hypothetical protein